MFNGCRRKIPNNSGFSWVQWTRPNVCDAPNETTIVQLLNARERERETRLEHLIKSERWTNSIGKFESDFNDFFTLISSILIHFSRKLLINESRPQTKTNKRLRISSYLPKCLSREEESCQKEACDSRSHPSETRVDILSTNCHRTKFNSHTYRTLRLQWSRVAEHRANLFVSSLCWTHLCYTLSPYYSSFFLLEYVFVCFIIFLLFSVCALVYQSLRSSFVFFFYLFLLIILS